VLPKNISFIPLIYLNQDSGSKGGERDRERDLTIKIPGNARLPS
jgi:hypothetical protein